MDLGRPLSIGAFSLLSGLSIRALRHYDEIGLLEPADVDSRTRYRRYNTNQLTTARMIRALRDVDVPIDEIAVALKSSAACREVLIGHRERLLVKTTDLTRLVTDVDEMIEKGVVVKQPTGARIGEISLLVDDVERSRAFYESAFDVQFAEDQHDGPKHLHTSFGTWPGDNFFMFTLWPAGDRQKTVTHFGFVVDDLDTAFSRAVAAGAKEFWGPTDSDAMPRNAKVGDPDGNKVFLYQA